jgi:hypothetical protein
VWQSGGLVMGCWLLLSVDRCQFWLHMLACSMHARQRYVLLCAVTSETDRHTTQHQLAAGCSMLQLEPQHCIACSNSSVDCLMPTFLPPQHTPCCCCPRRPSKRAKDANSSGAAPGSPSRTAAPKAEEGPLSSNSQQPGRLVECLVEGQAASASLDLSGCKSFREMWARLEQLVPQGLPDKLDTKIVYMDGDGDWIMLQPDTRWSVFASAASKILVSSRC